MKEFTEEYKNNKCIYIVTHFLLCAALLNIAEAILKSGIRYHYSSLSAEKLFGIQCIIAAGKVCLCFVVFLSCRYRLRKLDYYTAHAKPLLFFWGVILIGVQVVYDTTTVFYKRSLEQIMSLLGTTENPYNEMYYAAIYNNTHGFKYLGMYIAIILGIVGTGILLQNKRLIFDGLLLIILFVLAFGFLQMYTIRLEFLGISVGVVWTSVIFHCMNTVGLLYLAYFIRANYLIRIKKE